MFAQQAAARHQFEELRRRGLLAQNPPGDGTAEGPRGASLSVLRYAAGIGSRACPVAPPAPIPVPASSEPARASVRAARARS